MDPSELSGDQVWGVLVLQKSGGLCGRYHMTVHVTVYHSTFVSRYAALCDMGFSENWGGGGVPYLGCPYNKDPTIRGKIFLGRARATRGGGVVVVGWGSALL